MKRAKKQQANKSGGETKVNVTTAESKQTKQP